MKLDREMEMLLNEIPLLHHGDLLVRREADDDMSYLIQELAALGVVDEDEEEEMLPSPVAADELGFSGFL
ncbi:hypothetical protein NL478_27160, partial [Klebsiella pneumoniae]|nr:hypothetical protein [Klebsiella pneumoniae]